MNILTEIGKLLTLVVLFIVVFFSAAYSVVTMGWYALPLVLAVPLVLALVATDIFVRPAIHHPSRFGDAYLELKRPLPWRMRISYAWSQFRHFERNKLKHEIKTIIDKHGEGK